MNQLLIILGGTLILELILGDLQNPWYPVEFLKNIADRVGLKIRDYFGNSVTAGIIGWLLIVPVTVFSAWLLVKGVHWCFGVGELWLASLLVWSSISMRRLLQQTLSLIAPLRRGNLSVARRSLDEMTNFTTDKIISKDIIRYGIENIGVKLVGTVTSVFFWAILGWIIHGAAGAAAGAVFSRVVQVLEAQWGSRHGQYQKFGRFAVAVNHLTDWIPARLTAFAVAIAALPLGRCRIAFSMAWRHRRDFLSSNSSWIKAAFAGALSLTLGGPREYASGIKNYPYLGHSRAELKIADLKRAVRLAFFSVIIFLAFMILITAIFMT